MSCSILFSVNFFFYSFRFIYSSQWFLQEIFCIVFFWKYSLWTVKKTDNETYWLVEDCISSFQNLLSRILIQWITICDIFDQPIRYSMVKFLTNRIANRENPSWRYFFKVLVLRLVIECCFMWCSEIFFGDIRNLFCFLL